MPLTYGDLAAHVARTARHLRHKGLGTQSRVATSPRLGWRAPGVVQGWTGVFVEGVETADLPFDLHGALAPGSADLVANLLSPRLA